MQISDRHGNKRKSSVIPSHVCVITLCLSWGEQIQNFFSYNTQLHQITNHVGLNTMESQTNVLPEIHDGAWSHWTEKIPESKEEFYTKYFHLNVTELRKSWPTHRTGPNTSQRLPLKLCAKYFSVTENLHNLFAPNTPRFGQEAGDDCSFGEDRSKLLTAHQHAATAGVLSCLPADYRTGLTGTGPGAQSLRGPQT